MGLLQTLNDKACPLFPPSIIWALQIGMPIPCRYICSPGIRGMQCFRTFYPALEHPILF